MTAARVSVQKGVPHADQMENEASVVLMNKEAAVAIDRRKALDVRALRRGHTPST